MRDLPPVAIPPAKPPTSAPPPVPSALKGLKETIESILIAFILAFVFRAFIVEAFVIPTGSMAATLMGAHMRFTCKECGYAFTVNYSSPNRNPNSSEIDIPSRAGPEHELNSQGRPTGRMIDRVQDAWCPNCRFQVPKGDATNPLIHYGDRILVLKYIYLVSPAQRWDVVVFKDPTFQPQTPEEKKTYPPREKSLQWYSQNYIKRLIGLPGETLMILDGDIYVKDGETWKIQTKPAYAQDAMWRHVYDHDYRPINRNRKDWKLPWVPESKDNGWEVYPDDSAKRIFTFDKSRGSGAIRFADSNDPSYFTDWLAYNPNDPHRRRDYPVSDLKLAFTYERHGGDGPLRASLSKRDVTFVVELKRVKIKEGERDELQVVRRNAKPGEDKPEEKVILTYPLKPTTRARIEMMNVDHQFTLRLNGEMLCESKYEPNIAELRSRKAPVKPNVIIEAADQSATLSHVSLWRDVYYTPAVGGTPAQHATPDEPIILKADRGNQEYFVLGDNSEQSADARLWREDISLAQEDLDVAAGRVPERFMLGRAFFVYWPAGYKPFTETAPSIVPNFGEMRVIR